MQLNLTFPKLPSVVVITLLSLTVIATSCQKSLVEDKPSATTEANQQKLDVTNDIVDATGGTDENFDMVMGTGEYADDANALSRAKSTGKTITYDPSKDVYPHTKTIDYGTGWTNNQGVTKSGKVIITYFRPDDGTPGKLTLTKYDNYFVDGIQTEGFVRINQLKNNTGKTVYVHFLHKIITDASGNIKNFRTLGKWTVIDWQGGTANAYEIKDSTAGVETYNGIESNGFTAKSDDLNPVIRPFTCNRVQGGVIAQIHLVNPAPGNPNDLTEYLDYGNGDCDKTATLSINGGTPQTIALPLVFWPLSL